MLILFIKTQGEVFLQKETPDGRLCAQVAVGWKGSRGPSPPALLLLLAPGLLLIQHRRQDIVLYFFLPKSSKMCFHLLLTSFRVCRKV